MKNKKIYLLALVCVFSITFISGCVSSKDIKEPMKRTEFFMGTVVSVTLYDKGSEEILDKVFSRVKEIEDLVGINEENPETEIKRVNANAGISPIKVSEDTFDIVEEGIEYSKMSNGAFDISIGPLVKLWSIGLPEANIPTDEEIRNTLDKINYKDVILNDDDNTIFLKNKGMMLDLGGVAKGYAADEIVEILDDAEIESAIVDLGGNVFALGEKINGDAWKIGIQNPASTRGEIVGVIEVKDKSIVTSGIYERYIEDGDKRYHHILSPQDGYPFENDIAGVSIVSEESIDGDCLSTLVFALGLEDGMKFVEKTDGVEAIFITKDSSIYLTSGLKNNFSLTDSTYTIKQ